MLHPMEINFFRTLEGTVCQRVLGAFADRVSWIEDSPDPPKSIVAFIK